MPSRPDAVGQRVVYAARFLHSIGASPTDHRWFAKGEISKIDDGWLATVNWGTGSSTIALGNLLVEGSPVTAQEAPFECGNAWDGVGFRPTP